MSCKAEGEVLTSNSSSLEGGLVAGKSNVRGRLEQEWVVHGIRVASEGIRSGGHQMAPLQHSLQDLQAVLPYAVLVDVLHVLARCAQESQTICFKLVWIGHPAGATTLVGTQQFVPGCSCQYMQAATRKEPQSSQPALESMLNVGKLSFQSQPDLPSPCKALARSASLTLLSACSALQVAGGMEP